MALLPMLRLSVAARVVAGGIAVRGILVCPAAALSVTCKRRGLGIRACEGFRVEPRAIQSRDQAGQILTQRDAHDLLCGSYDHMCLSLPLMNMNIDGGSSRRRN